MLKPVQLDITTSIEETEALLALVSRLAGLHAKLRAEIRFCESVELEGISSLISVAQLPLESAIVELGRLATGKPPSVSSRA